MESRLLLIFFVSVLLTILGKAISARDELTFENLKETNISCYLMDFCLRKPDTFTVNFPFPDNSCSCDSQCSKFGTCCIDSPYRDNSPQTHHCRKINVERYYVVDRCPDNIDKDIVWKSLCEKEWEREDDVLKVTPVTSLQTNTTYRNVYCFRCHETTDEFLYWKIILQGTAYNSSDFHEDSVFIVTYNQTADDWLATTAEGNISFPVYLEFQIPEEVEFSVIECDLRHEVECSVNWTEAKVREMCNAYTDFLMADFSVMYKNKHCGFCKFNPLYMFTCIISQVKSLSVFSFHYLLDLNHPNGEKVGKIKKCELNYTWNRFRQACETCALPGYVIKDGRCTPP